MTGLTVMWQNQTATAIDQAAVEASLENVLRHLERVGTVKLEITLVGDATIAKLKDRFLGVKEATDVLSFSNPADQTDLLGSLVISVETAKRQAQDAGVNLIEEIKMLASHGLLHLLGYHHA